MSGRYLDFYRNIRDRSSSANRSGIRFAVLGRSGTILIKSPMYELRVRDRLLLYSVSPEDWIYVYDPKSPTARLPFTAQSGHTTLVGNHFTIGRGTDCPHHIDNDVVVMHKTLYEYDDRARSTSTRFSPYARARPATHRRLNIACNFSISDLSSGDVPNVQCVSCNIHDQKQSMKDRFSEEDIHILEDILSFGTNNRTEGGGAAEYITYDGRRYKVRTGKYGGRYINRGGKKLYVQRGGEKEEERELADHALLALQQAFSPAHEVCIFYDNSHVVIVPQTDPALVYHVNLGDTTTRVAAASTVSRTRTMTVA